MAIGSLIIALAVKLKEAKIKFYKTIIEMTTRLWERFLVKQVLIYL
tara:strand:+ start:71 stop:208 length:138 start_codon:yes stop_codon:yes gene_type:complete